MTGNQLLQSYLMHSFLYYELDSPVISDKDYDSICKQLLDKWDEVEHQHKYLLDKSALEAGSGYHLSGHYPLMVQLAAQKHLGT